MPLIILVFNGILAVVALLNMYSAVAQVRISASVQYSSFLQLYAFVATLEFLLLMFIMPALTSGSISGERERQTLELLFTTRMTPKDIVMGKLFSALSQLMVLIVSSFPILLLTFVYGSMDPVSYTHLDVYKRQPLCDRRHRDLFPDLPAFAEKVHPVHRNCLLYTSRCV